MEKIISWIHTYIHETTICFIKYCWLNHNWLCSLNTHYKHGLQYKVAGFATPEQAILASYFLEGSWLLSGRYKGALSADITWETKSTSIQSLLVSWQPEWREEISLILLIYQSVSVLVLWSIFCLAYFILTASIGGQLFRARQVDNTIDAIHKRQKGVLLFIIYVEPVEIPSYKWLTNYNQFVFVNHRAM